MASILIVEDDPDIAEGLSDLLALAGHDCRLAADGNQGLEALERELPGLILLDLMMPKVDGFEFRRRQLEHARAARVPVIVITADQTAAARASELKAPVLAKPFAAEQLLELVAAALSQR